MCVWRVVSGLVMKTHIHAFIISTIRNFFGFVYQNKVILITLSAPLAGESSFFLQSNESLTET